MNRRLLPILAVFLLSCQPLALLYPSPTPSPSPAPTATITPTATPLPAEEPAYTVRIHPEDGLYVGDLISFEVLALGEFRQPVVEGEEVAEMSVVIEVEAPVSQVFGPAPFESFGVGGRQQATFEWVWDTSDLEPGEYYLNFRIQPEGPRWSQTIVLFPQDALPPTALEAEWLTTATECCRITYLTGTAAEREIEDVIEIVNRKAAESYAEMEIETVDQLHIVLIPRVLGHGGFASGEIYLSYLDRNYTGDNFAHVLYHEIVHILDFSLDGDYRPRILVEGFAVYKTRGHYKRELLLPRAAALLDLGWYIPLSRLSNDFYFHQHEIGYIQAGALVEFIVSQWGYPAFDAFYRDIHAHESGKDSDSIDRTLQAHFGITLIDLERQFLSVLRRTRLLPEFIEDAFLTVKFYDTVRRYQEILDPSAHFLNAWLVTFPELRSLDIAADYMRHPSQPENLALETLLISAYSALQQFSFKEARHILAAVNTVLNGLENDYPQPFETHPLAESYLEIVILLIGLGYQPQQITLNENSAQVLVTEAGPNLYTRSLIFSGDAWQME